MKDQILKMAGVKSEKEFYNKFPTEESFKAKYGKQLKKAEMGRKMVNTQLHQLTDFGNPPIAQNGINFNDLMTNASAKNAGMSAQAYTAAQQKQQQPAPSSGGGLGDLIGTAVKYAPQIMEAIGKNGKKIKKAQDGSWASAGVPGLSTASFDKSTGLVNNASGSVSQADTTALGFADKAPSSGFDAAGAAMAGIGIAPQIIAGAQKIKQQKTDIQKAHTAADVSGLTAQAAGLRPELVKNKYVRPEDNIAQPGQLGNPQGTGTNFLSAANGTMIGGNPTQVQNTYAPGGDLYGDLGYEPLNDSNTKQYRKGGYFPTAEFGDYFQDSGQAEIGGAAGQAIGTAFFGPIGGMAGKLLGNVAGNLLGGADDMNKLHNYQDTTKRNTQQAAFASGANALHAQNSAHMEEGGWVSNNWQPQVIAHFGDMDVSQVHSFAHQGMDSLRAGGHLKEYTPPSAEAMFTGRPNMALGGELETHWGGGLETLSQNPYDASETIMPKGNSHDESDGKGRTGIGITYGKNPVEVERNEPMIKMKDGGNQENLVVFGNMPINDFAANHIGDKDAKGIKFKNYVADLSKSDNKQNSIKDKATEALDKYKGNTPFDQFKMNSAMARLTGANMTLKENAAKKQRAAAVQNAILDTAEEHGLDSDSLAKGKIKQAKKGAKIIKAEDGIQPVSGNGIGAQAVGIDQPTFFTPTSSSASDIFNDYAGGIPSDSTSANQPANGPGFGQKAWDITKKVGKAIGKGANSPLSQAALSAAMPFLRPTNQRPLDPSQTYPEMMAMALNQVQPVKAQGYEPMLQDQPSRISLQDQLNNINSQGRAALQQLGNNPSAVATVMANLADAKNKVLGEQFRMNQQSADQTYAANRAAINQSKLQNLQIYDTQATRQSEAASKTKQQAIEIAKSLAAKTLQNQLENRDLAIKENLYNYRFSPSGVAYNVNDPYQFNLAGTGNSNSGRQQAPAGFKFLYDAAGNVEDMKKEKAAKSGAKLKARNGSIVQAMKSL